MIWESSFWKDELLKLAKNLRERKVQRRWVSVSYARVEQSVMIGFYSVRKLVEAKKLSDDTVARTIPILSYQSREKPVTRSNWHRLEELYDMERHSVEEMKLFDLANQFIHSYVFMLALEENSGLESVFFCSDRRRNRKLYRVTVDSLIEVFTEVGEDYPNCIHSTWREDLNDYEVHSYTKQGSDRESDFTNL